MYLRPKNQTSKGFSEAKNELNEICFTKAYPQFVNTHVSNLDFLLQMYKLQKNNCAKDRRMIP